MKNRIVRHEVCFMCSEQLPVMEYEPYNHDSYIRITVVNGAQQTKSAVCHRCFNARVFCFTELGWTFNVCGDWGSVREAIYVMRDIQQRVFDADGWHCLKSAQEYLWKQEPDYSAA